GDDTINGAVGTLQAIDIIIDQKTTDNDVLNATLGSAQIVADLNPTIQNIENINLNIDAFSAGINTGGTATDYTYNAANTEGATITLSSAKAGFNGLAGVINAGENNVTAGTGIKELNVAGMGTGVVDFGSATKGDFDVDTTLSTTANVIVNGNMTSFATGAAVKTLNVTATANSVLATDSNALASTVTNIKGSGDITFKGASADLTGKKVVNQGEGQLIIETTESVDYDLKNMQVDTVKLFAGYASTLTVNSGVAVQALGAVGAATITNGSDLKAGQVGSEASLALNGALTSLTTNNFQTLNLSIAKDTSIGAVTMTPGAILAAAGVQTTAKVTGTGDLTVSTASTANTFDASGLNGDVTYVAAKDADQTILGGTGANKLSFVNDLTKAVSYTGQNGGDTVTANLDAGTLAMETGSGADTINITKLGNNSTFTATLGAGKDVVKIGADATTKLNIGTGVTFILDGGADADTLYINGATAKANGSILSNAAAGSKVSNFETLVLQETAKNGGATVEVGSYVVSGNTMKVEGGYLAGETATTGKFNLIVNDGATNVAQTIDLSGLTFNALKPVAQIEVVGSNKADTITGPNVDATHQAHINAGEGNDTIILGSGAGKTFVDINKGNNTIDLSAATAANELVFSQAVADTGLNTINGWKSQTVLNVNELGSNGVTDEIDAKSDITVGNKNAFALTAKTAYVINTTGQAANLSLEGTAVITDFTSANQVSAYLDERVSTAATGDYVFVINNTNSGANASYVWAFTNAVADTVEASELKLVGVIDNGGSALNSTTNIDVVATTYTAIA
ncbi:MAG: hypothetical protein WCS28_10840, partial [Thiomicrospira sp.]